MHCPDWPCKQSLLMQSRLRKECYLKIQVVYRICLKHPHSISYQLNDVCARDRPQFLFVDLRCAVCVYIGKPYPKVDDSLQERKHVLSLKMFRQLKLFSALNAIVEWIGKLLLAMCPYKHFLCDDYRQFFPAVRGHLVKNWIQKIDGNW